MTKTAQFQLAAGTITGRDHLQPLKWSNGQDGLCTLDLIEKSGIAIAVVSDGCGSGQHSEVGAKIAARFVAQSILRYLPGYINGVEKNLSDPYIFRYWEDIRLDLLATLRPLAQRLDSSMAEAVKDYFLFTLIGFIVTPHGSFVFSIGDGVYSVNGEVTRIGPFNTAKKENAPPYIGYGLLRADQGDVDPELCKFQVNRAMPTATVQSILVGSDGVVDFMAAEKKALPGQIDKDGCLGPLSQFWTDDRYFTNPDGTRNPDGIRRKLALANNSSIAPDWANWREERIHRKPGLLPDDVTLAVIRRVEPPKLTEAKS